MFNLLSNNLYILQIYTDFLLFIVRECLKLTVQLSNVQKININK